MKALVLGGAPAHRMLTFEIHDVPVKVACAPYDPVSEETARLRVATAAREAEDAVDLLELLTPEAAAALRVGDPVTMEAAGLIYVAALLGAERATAWDGICDPEGETLPFSPERWQLACFTIPRFAASFLTHYLAPHTAEIQAGNASAPVPNGLSAAGAQTATDAGNA